MLLGHAAETTFSGSVWWYQEGEVIRNLQPCLKFQLRMWIFIQPPSTVFTFCCMFFCAMSSTLELCFQVACLGTTIIKSIIIIKQEIYSRPLKICWFNSFWPLWKLCNDWIDLLPILTQPHESLWSDAIQEGALSPCQQMYLTEKNIILFYKYSTNGGNIHKHWVTSISPNLNNYCFYIDPLCQVIVHQLKITVLSLLMLLLY